MKNKISIIVPVYNSESTIRRCIDSVVSQTYENWELILIDDGSEDNSRRIIGEYTDERIRVISRENHGVSYSRNQGILESKGEYLVFLDSDDWLEKEACSLFVREMDDCDLCISGFQFFGDANLCRNLKNDSISEGLYDILKFEEVFSKLYSVGYINAPWAKCFKKSLITTLFDINISIGEDLLFNLSYLRNCKKIRLVSKITYDYLFMTQMSLSGKISMKYDMQIDMYNQCRKILKEIFGANNKGIYVTNQRYLMSIFSMLNYDIKNKKIKSYAEFNDIIKKCNIYYYSKETKIMDIDKKWEIFRILAKYRYFAVLFIILKTKSVLTNNKTK